MFSLAPYLLHLPLNSFLPAHLHIDTIFFIAGDEKLISETKSTQVTGCVAFNYIIALQLDYFC